MDVCIAEPQETAIYVEDWMVPPGVVEQETLNVISPLYIFPLKTCVTPGPWIVGFSPQSLLLLCNMPTMLSVDFVFLYPASHFMDQYCSIWSWTHEKFSMHHHLLKDRRCYFFFFFCHLSILLWLLGILQFWSQFTQWNESWGCVTVLLEV